jgi:hypothetical protein
LIKMNKERMSRIYLSIIILIAYLSLNIGFAAGSVLCVNTDGDVLFKFSSCEVCCSSCSDHSHESMTDRAGVSNKFQTEESCYPCSDIPISTYIAQFHSRAPEDIDEAYMSLAFESELVFTPIITAGVFDSPRIFTQLSQIFSLLKTSILLI